MLNSLFQTSANKSNGLVFCAVCLCSSIGRRSFRHRTMHAMELVLRRDATSHQLSLMVLFRISCIWKKSVPMARLLQWEHYVLLGALGCLARDTDTEKLLAMAGSANIFVSGFLAKAVVKFILCRLSALRMQYSIRGDNLSLVFFLLGSEWWI